MIPIFEPGLSNMVKENFANGHLNFTTDAKEAVEYGDLQFIAVGTPPDEDGSADLQYVLQVAETVATHMTSPKVVVTKSTVPVGTADKVTAKIEETLKARSPNQEQDLDFDVASFRAPDFEEIKSKLKEPVIFDGRNMFEPEIVRNYGLKYFAIGRS